MTMGIASFGMTKKKTVIIFTQNVVRIRDVIVYV